MPVCLRVRENRVTVLEMLWTSSPSLATSQLTALRMSDSLKPAPATPMMEAMIPVVTDQSHVVLEGRGSELDSSTDTIGGDQAARDGDVGI
jgi:hypothetical protein